MSVILSQLPHLLQEVSWKGATIPAMSERNRCLESGCRGFCCQDITIYDAEEVILKTFPNAKEVNTWQLQKAINGKLSNGVYYQYDGRDPVPGMAIARVAGPCPNKVKDGNCNIHDIREHAAENFKFGGGECNAIRRENGLGPIYLEPVE